MAEGESESSSSRSRSTGREKQPAFLSSSSSLCLLLGEASGLLLRKRWWRSAGTARISKSVGTKGLGWGRARHPAPLNETSFASFPSSIALLPPQVAERPASASPQVPNCSALKGDSPYFVPYQRSERPLHEGFCWVCVFGFVIIFLGGARVFKVLEQDDEKARRQDRKRQKKTEKRQKKDRNRQEQTGK